MVSYTDLAGLMTAYGDVGLTVLAFPCNLENEPGLRIQLRMGKNVCMAQIRKYTEIHTVYTEYMQYIQNGCSTEWYKNAKY